MRLHGQRWEFRVGNSLIQADNAFTWGLWSQERLIVNEEVTQRSGGRGVRLLQHYDEPWLTWIGEEKLLIKLTSHLTGISCQALLSDETLEPHALLDATWEGPPHSWPGNDGWKPIGERSWIARVPGSQPRSRS